jgi:cysteine desulfurase
MSKNRRTVYLDYSASTPTDPRVVEAMMPYFTEVYGNASSLHSFGRKAEQAIEDARETLAKIFNCQPSEIIFTSGGSESDNLAIRGAAWTAKERGNHLITTPVEHSAVSRTVGQLADMMDFEKTVLPVDQHGMVDVEEFANACHSGTTVASIIYANNEVGTIAPIPQLAAQAKERGVLFHTDAVQAAGQLTLDVQTLGVDMMSISGHKFYGPKGVGALYVRKGIDLSPHMTGGSHESGRRAGTHNTPFIVGMAKALQLAHDERESRLAHYRTMRDALIDGISNSISDTHLTGHPEQRLPSHASFVFEGVDSTKLLMYLDMKGIAASSASACKTGNPEPSGVLLAMGYKPELASGSLRLSVGQHTTMEDVEYTLIALAESVEKLRKLNKAFAG